MPPGKAREFMNKLINQYKKNTGYDPATGNINQSQNLMSFNEDFWFDQHDGKGSSVTTLQSGMNLGELRDIDYFKNKMYMTLKLPKSRWEDSGAMFQGGKNGEISREEIKFDQFVERVQNRFSDLFTDVLITHLKMKGIDDQYLDPGKFHYKFTKANYFAEQKKLEQTETRLSVLSNAATLLYSPMNPNGLFASEYVLKHFFMMSDEEYDENKELLEKFKKENPPMNPFGDQNGDGSGNNNFGGGNPEGGSQNGSPNKPEFEDFGKDLSKNKKEKKPVEKKKSRDEQIKENLEDNDII
jgi:hypothetical protein